METITKVINKIQEDEDFYISNPFILKHIGILFNISVLSCSLTILCIVYSILLFFK